MGICILGCGDCGNKSSAEFKSNVSVINKAVTNMVSNVSQSTNVQTFNSQDIHLEFKGDLTDCPITSTQTMSANQTVKVSLDVTNKKNLQNQVTNALITSNKSAINQKSGFLQTASNSASTATTVDEAISNLVDTNISDTVYQGLSQMMSNLQNKTMVFYGNMDCKGRTLVFGQDMLVSQIADALTKALTGTTLSTINNTTSNIENVSSSDQEGKGVSEAIAALFKGIAGVFSSIFKGIGDMVSSPGMIIMVLIILAVIGFIGYKKMQSSGMAFGRKRRW